MPPPPAEEIPCHVFTGENEVSKTKKRISENFYRDTYDFVTEAEAAYNLYQAGVSIKDMAKLWGVETTRAPEELVAVGRYFHGAVEARPHDKLRKLLQSVKGGREAVASVIGAFTERHGGHEESELPEEAIPIITDLFQAAVDGDWEPEHLLAEAKAKAKELALERAMASLEEGKWVAQKPPLG